MDNLLLAIETSVKAGSLSLLNGMQVIANWTGNNDVSMSQDLIPQIERLLQDKQVRPSQLKKIAVSIGPGSFTGIRVGIATAKALALALNCSLHGVSILDAFAFINTSAITKPSIDAEIEKVMTVVFAGRELYFWQVFQNSVSISEPTTGNLECLITDLENYEISRILTDTAAYESFSHTEIKNLFDANIITGNYAELIGLTAIQINQKSEDVSPLYIRPAVITRT